MSEIIESFTIPTVVVGIVIGVLTTLVTSLFMRPISHLRSISIKWYQGEVSSRRKYHLLFVSDLSEDANLVQLMTTKINSHYLQSAVSFIMSAFSFVLIGASSLPNDGASKELLTLGELNPLLIIPLGFILFFFASLTEGSKIFRMIDQSIYLRRQREKNIEGFYSDEKLRGATDEEIYKLYILLNGTIWQRLFRR